MCYPAKSLTLEPKFSFSENNIMKRLRLLKECESDGRTLAVGSHIEVSPDYAQDLITKGIAEEVSAPVLITKEMAKKDDATTQEQLAIIQQKYEEVTAELSRIKATQITEKDRLALTITPEKPAEKKFRTLGENLLSIVKAYKHGSIDESLRFVMDNWLMKASGMNEAIPSEGGFLLQDEYEQTLWRLAYETGRIASLCSRRPLGANANRFVWNAIDETSRVNGSRFGGMQVYRVNEAAAGTKSKPKFDRRSIELEKLLGVYYATEELLQDATGLASEVQQWFAEEFGFKLDWEILWGTGAGEMLGIMNSGALVTGTKDGSQTATTVTVGNISKMFARQWAPGIPRAVWLMNQDVLPQIIVMVIGTYPIFTPPVGGIAAAPYGTLLGRPIVPVEQASTMGTAGDVIFADLSQYLIIEKGGLEAAQSIHLKFLEGETAFRFMLRNNGQPRWKSAVTPNKGSSTVSPFVTIETRS
jgi:HK97 family phage major capsid protein